MSSLTGGPESRPDRHPAPSADPLADPRAAARRRSAVEAAAALRDAFRAGRPQNPPTLRADAAMPTLRADAAMSGGALRAAMATAQARMLVPDVEPSAPFRVEAPVDLPRTLSNRVGRGDGARAHPPVCAPVALASEDAPPALPVPAAETMMDRLDAALSRAPVRAPKVPAASAAVPIAAPSIAPAPIAPATTAARREPSLGAPFLRPDPSAPTAARAEPAAPKAAPVLHAAEARPAPPPQTTRPRRGDPEARQPDIRQPQIRPGRRALGAAFGAGLAGLGARLSRTPVRRPDPSPSLWRYRLDRLRRRASVQFALRHLLAPMAVLALGVWLWNQQAVWVWGEQQVAELREAIEARPEFAVTGLAISGGSPRLRTLTHEEIGLRAPVSSLALDLDALRKRIEALPGIASARLTIGPDGILRAALTERIPVALWRWDGQLHLVDYEGVVIGPVAARADRPALPLIIGAGADRAVPEALALHARAAPLRGRLRALVRVGERRWTLALDRDQAIMLPAKGAEPALARVLALDTAEDLLAREVSVIDMRLPRRPTLRITDRAVAELLRLRAIVAGEDA
ncbi:MAG: cell division protein FtsQ [Planctomycetota bacterium]|jgi:cell division protein FtsQ